MKSVSNYDKVSTEDSDFVYVGNANSPNNNGLATPVARLVLVDEGLTGQQNMPSSGQLPVNTVSYQSETTSISSRMQSGGSSNSYNNHHGMLQ
jgi:hypothetical protein